MPAGRPTLYTEELVDDIINRLTDGESLVKICDSDGMPKCAVVYRWLALHEEFSDRYARARADQAERYLDEILEIADKEEDVQRAKLKIDTRKWTMGKLKPKKYGDKQTNVFEDPDGKALTPILNVNLTTNKPNTTPEAD